MKVYLCISSLIICWVCLYLNFFKYMNIISQNRQFEQHQNENEKQLQIKKAFLHTWNNYYTYAWGKDEINPVTGKGRDNWGGVAVTLIDALDTAIIMNLNEQVENAISFLAQNFTFRKDHRMNTFEMTIRVLGGLLSSYDLTNDPRLLNMTIHVADLLLPVFKENDVLPEINTKTLTSFNGYTTLASKGSVQFEYFRLYHITNDKRFLKAANTWKIFEKKAIEMISLNGGYDSIHEYLLKIYILQNKKDKDLKTKYNQMIQFAVERVVFEQKNGKVFMIDKNYFMEHLACFFPGTMILGILSQVSEYTKRDLKIALQLLSTCYDLYVTNNKTGLAPDSFYVKKSNIHITNPKFDLRPETIESIYYAWKLTKNQKYRDWAWKIFESIELHCKSQFGYSGLLNVHTGEKNQDQPSFWMAEVLKYLYLIFHDDIIDLDRFVFNTEAHPMKILKNK